MPFLMVLLRRRLHFLPIITAVFITASFLISYIIAVANGHVEPDFPYISFIHYFSSHTAIEAPERSIFAQLVNIGAFMLVVNVGVRLLQMKAVLLHLKADRRDHRINKASAIIGVLSAFGLTLVANFQTEGRPDMKVVHYIGAGFSFICGACYCWLQTVISLRYRRRGCVTVAQLINSAILTVVFVIFVISKVIYRVEEANCHGTKYTSLRAVYLVSTITEWLTALSIVTFALTFYRDFQAGELIMPKVEIICNDHVDSNYRRPMDHPPTLVQSNV